MAIAWTPDLKFFFKKLVFKFTYGYTSMPIYGSKFQNLGGERNGQLFDILKIIKNQHFLTQQMTDQWLIQKSKPRWHTYWLIPDENSQCQVPSKLSQMCQKMKPAHLKPCQTPQVCHTPWKLYHHIA